MKHYVFTGFLTSLFLLVALLTSCEKPLLSETSEDQTSQGNLNVNVLQIEQTPFASLTRTALADVCTRLSFAVYSADGTRVKQVNQTSEHTSFGQASFSLEEGNYKVVVVAHSSDGNPTMTNAAKIQFSNALGFTDTFLGTSDVTIGDEAVDVDISLNRIVALCRFVVTDDYPENLSKIHFYYTGGSGTFDASTGFGSVNSKQSVWCENLTASQKQFDLYTFLHDTEGSIHLQVTAYDDADNIINEREYDVPLQQNKITWFSGSYFTGGSSSNTFTVTVNADWAGEVHLNF